MKHLFTIVSICLIFVFTGLAGVQGFAATITTTGTGNWSSVTPNAPWPGGTIPAAGDNIIIGVGFTLTVDGNRTCNSIGFNSSSSGTGTGILTVNSGFQLTVTTVISCPASGVSTKNTGSYNISGLGTISCASFDCNNNAVPGASGSSTITLISNISAINISGNLTLNATYASGGSKTNNPTFNVQSGTVTVNGSVISINQNAANIAHLDLLTSAASPVLILAGAIPFSLSATGTNTINLSGTGALVNYSNAGAQTILPTTYNNLTLSGGAAKTTTGSTINGLLSMQGTATTAGTVATYSAAATLEYKGSAAQTTGIEFPATWSGTGGVKINNTNGVILNAARSIGANPLSIGNTVSNSIFNDGGFQLTATGTLNLTSGTYKLGSTVAATAFPVFSARNINAGTTVEYASGVTQTVAAISYSNLTLSGAGQKNAAGTVAVAVVLTNASVFDMAAFTLTPGTSTINTNGTIRFSAASNGLAVATGTVEYYGATQMVTTGNYATLNITAAGTKTVSGAITATAIDNGGVSNVAAVLDMAGNRLTATTIENTGATIRFSAASNGLAIGTGTVEYYGASQNIAAGSYQNLKINQSGGDASLVGATGASGILTMASGNILCGAYTISVFNSAVGAVVRTGGHVIGNLQRTIATGTNNYAYPVGTSAGYTPVSLAFSSVGTGGNVTVKSIDGVSGNYPVALHATKYLNRYWSISNTGVSSFTANAGFSFLPGDLAGGSTAAGLKAFSAAAGPVYTYPIAVNQNISGTTYNYNNLSAFGEFGAGECKGPLSPGFTKTMASACGGGADGTITVTPAGGTAPYSYSWTSTPSGFTANTAMITGLAPKDYTVVVSEVTTCSSFIPDITIWQAFATVVTNNGGGSASCSPTGFISLYGSGGIPPYTYSINGTNYFGSNIFTALAAGTYTGYVKDFTGCVSTKPNIVVTGAATMLVTANTRPASSCANNGSIELYRTGGVAPYTYSLDDVTYYGANVFSNLAGGTYTGRVKDSKGCKASLTGITVVKAAAVTVTSVKTNTSACSNTGRIQILGGGGVPGYTYSLNNVTYQAGNTFTGLAAGTYNAWVKDSKGCKNVQFGITVGINAAAAITVTANTNSAGSCANIGFIQLFRTGGTGPYTYSLNNVTYQTGNTFTGLAGGIYTGWVKDVNGCTGLLAGITVAQAVSITVTERHTNTSSCANDGTIQLNHGVGVPGYTYSLNNITYQAGNTFSGLATGNYTAWVKDSRGCTASVPVTIGQTAAIAVTAYAVSVHSCNMSNGSIQLFRTGGTGPYTYSLTGVTFQMSNVFTGLIAGIYTGYVKDFKGCIGSLANIVVGPGCAPPIAGPGTNSRLNTAKVSGNEILSLQAYPNPSATEFTLAVTSKSKEKIAISVTDIMGRKVYQAAAVSKQPFRFGNDLQPGIYMVQVIQGDQKQNIKLVKE